MDIVSRAYPGDARIPLCLVQLPVEGGSDVSIAFLRRGVQRARRRRWAARGRSPASDAAEAVVWRSSDPITIRVLFTRRTSQPSPGTATHPVPPRLPSASTSPRPAQSLFPRTRPAQPPLVSPHAPPHAMAKQFDPNNAQNLVEVRTSEAPERVIRPPCSPAPRPPPPRRSRNSECENVLFARACSFVVAERGPPPKKGSPSRPSSTPRCVWPPPVHALLSFRVLTSGVLCVVAVCGLAGRRTGTCLRRWPRATSSSPSACRPA